MISGIAELALSRSRKNIPVMDYDAKHRLFHKTIAEARDMVARAVAYIVSESPFVIALTNKPRNHRAQVDVDAMRPDRSLSMGRKVMAGAAQGDAASISFLHAWRGATLLTGIDQNGKPVWGGSKISPVVPQAFVDAGHRGSILYMPSAGKLTNKPPRAKRKKAKTRLTKAQLLEGFDNPNNWVEVATFEELKTHMLKEL
jgi:hypothetical protein